MFELTLHYTSVLELRTHTASCRRLYPARRVHCRDGPFPQLQRYHRRAQTTRRRLVPGLYASACSDSHRYSLAVHRIHEHERHEHCANPLGVNFPVPLSQFH